MKKKLLFICILLSIILFNLTCSKNEIDKFESQQMKVSDFSKIGEIHNMFLSNVKANFNRIENISEQSDKIEIINKFNQSFISKLEISNREKEELKIGLENNKNLVLEQTLIEKCFGLRKTNKFSSNKTKNYNLFELLANLKGTNQFGDKSYDILYMFAITLKKNYKGELSDSELKQNIEGLIKEFDEFGYESNSGEGEFVATILSISKSSLDWWNENQDALENLSSKNSTFDKTDIAPWLTADLIGGAISGAVAASGQYLLNGDVDWGTVGWSALGGGVAASTGSVGKIVKWLLY